MGVSFNTTVTQLEKWAAPKEIEKSGFGKLKIQDQELPVCKKAAEDIHKIGEQLRLLGNSNKTKGKQEWEGNEPVVQKLISQIHELGATLEGMKAASSNLKTRDEIKAAIKFTKQIASKVSQIEDAIGGIKDKVDDTSKKYLLGITKGLLDDVINKNAAVRADLTEMKISKHVKPEAKAKVDFLRVYNGVSKLPGIGKFIKAFTGLFVDLNTKVKTRLDTQLASLESSLKQLNTVSGNITSSTETGELLKRTQEAKDRLADFSGKVKGIMEPKRPNDYALLVSGDKAQTQTKNMLGALSQLQTTLQQKQELFKQQEALAPIKLDFDRTHEFDISSARTLLNKLERCKRDLLAATQDGIAPENEQINQNLLTQIDALSIRATLRLEQFGLITIDEASGLESYQVTVEKLERQYQELQREVGYVLTEAGRNPGLAQHVHIRLSERITQFEGLQEHTRGEKPELTAHKAHVRELRTELQQSEVIIRTNLQLEATRLNGQTEGLTGIFEALNRLAADLQTPETEQLKERLEEIRAHHAVAGGIYRELQNNPIQRESPNYQKYNNELFRAREAVAMAGELISNFDEKIVLEGIRTDLSLLDKERTNLLGPEAWSENLAAQEQEVNEEGTGTNLLQKREKNLLELHGALQAIDNLLNMIAPEKTSPNKALFDDIQTSVAALRGEVEKNYYENKVGVLSSKILTLDETVRTNFSKATLADIDRWQETLADHELNLKNICDQLPADQRTNKISVELDTFDSTAAGLKNLLADRKILIETRDRLNELNNLTEKNIINNNITVEDRLVLLQYQIEISLPDMKESLAGVSTTDPRKENFTAYRKLTDDIDATLENLTKVQLGYQRSPESFLKLEEFGKNTQEQITKKIEDIRANATLTAGQQNAELQNYRKTVIPKFQQLSESLTTFLPQGEQLKTFKEGNANRVRELHTLVDNQLQATANLFANMETAKIEMLKIPTFASQIKNMKEVWKFDQIETLTSLEESLENLRKCQAIAEEGSIERKEIDHAIMESEKLIDSYLNKSRDYFMQRLNDIRHNEEPDFSLQVIQNALAELSSELTKSQDSLIETKIDKNKINKIYDKLKNEVENDNIIVEEIRSLTLNTNTIILDSKNKYHINDDLKNKITEINKAYIDCKTKATYHYWPHFDALEDLLKPLIRKVNTTIIS